jgi:hypothetical protein
MNGEQPKSEAEWKAYNDAMTLMNAQAIMNDDVRYRAALVQAKKIAKEKEAELTGILAIIDEEEER